MKMACRFLAILTSLLLMTAGNYQAFAASNTEDKGVGEMPLREMLKRAFNIDVPISGGLGSSQTDTIVVHGSLPTQVSLTMVQTLRGIGKSIDVLWHTIGQEIVERDGRNLVRFKVLTKHGTETEIVTQQNNHYFDIGSTGSGWQPTLNPIVYIDQSSNVKLPYEIGWFHFDNIIDNEAKVKGMGQSIAYGAPGIKANIYIYDKGLPLIPSDIDSQIVRGEFQSAVADFKTVYPDPFVRGEPARIRYFLIQTFNVGDDVAYVGLGSVKGKFIKIRITHKQDQLFYDCVRESVSALIQWLDQQDGVPGAAAN